MIMFEELRRRIHFHTVNFGCRPLVLALSREEYEQFNKEAMEYLTVLKGGPLSFNFDAPASFEGVPIRRWYELIKDVAQ